MIKDIFEPYGNTVNIANPTTTTSSVALTAPPGSNYMRKLDAGKVCVEIFNDSNTTVFVKFGTSTVTAVAASDYPVAAGAIIMRSVGNEITHAAAITSSATATGNVYFTTGEGS